MAAAVTDSRSLWTHSKERRIETCNTITVNFFCHLNFTVFIGPGSRGLKTRMTIRTWDRATAAGPSGFLPSPGQNAVVRRRKRGTSCQSGAQFSKSVAADSRANQPVRRQAPPRHCRSPAQTRGNGIFFFILIDRPRRPGQFPVYAAGAFHARFPLSGRTRLSSQSTLMPDPPRDTVTSSYSLTICISISTSW